MVKFTNFALGLAGDGQRLIVLNHGNHLKRNGLTHFNHLAQRLRLSKHRTGRAAKDWMMFTLNDLQLRELRTPIAGSLAYLSGCGEAGRADWLNISRSGAALRLGRYLRPGHRVELMPAADWSIGARVAWCARVPGSLQFVAGLIIDRSCPEGALRFAALGYGAQGANKNTPYSVVTSVWPSLAATAEPATRPNDLVRAV